MFGIWYLSNAKLLSPQYALISLDESCYGSKLVSSCDRIHVRAAEQKKLLFSLESSENVSKAEPSTNHFGGHVNSLIAQRVIRACWELYNGMKLSRLKRLHKQYDPLGPESRRKLG